LNFKIHKLRGNEFINALDEAPCIIGKEIDFKIVDKMEYEENMGIFVSLMINISTLMQKVFKIN
jgi:hypothetical protein